MKEPASYAEAVSYLDGVPLFTKKNDLDNTRRLLGLLGHPEAHFRVIHVAGTNGKGSTCAFLESIFRNMGLRTGLFTSPHLVRINERIRVCGGEIPDEGFYEMFVRVFRASMQLTGEGGSHPTWFEFLFAMGMCWFQKSGIDLLVCETGMGGRLDATNSIGSVDAEVITSISLDHTKYLGDTVEKIAFEKAGIIREGVPVVYCAKDPRSTRVIERAAIGKRAERIPLREDRFLVEGRSPGAVSVKLILPGGQANLGPEGDTILLRVPFGAEYQAENASLAALCALRLGADRENVRRGIEKTRWSGRMEEIRKDVFLDGAHNADGIRAAAAEIRRIASVRSVRLVAAIVSDKNYSQMVRELCRDVKYEGIIVTAVGGDRKLSCQILAEEFVSAGQRCVEQEPEPLRAYRRALEEKGDSVLFCVGSLYLVGEILSAEPAGGRPEGG